jgi:beta-lactamase class A
MSKSLYLVIPLALFLGIITERFLIQPLMQTKDNSNIQVIRQEGYRFISPLLRCDIPTSASTKTMKDLSQKIKNNINESISTNNAENVSVYFRDVHSSEWFVLNENDTYAPASLLKVPIMMAVYKRSQSHPEILTKEIKFDGGSDNYGQKYQTQNELQEGKSYTGNELVEHMVIESDNTAKNILLASMSPEEQSRVFDELKVEILHDAEEFITVQNYSIFFRALYSAIYLGPELSEKALELLTKSSFKDGIVAGVPQGVLVAHKFGERDGQEGSPEQLHDCGIVYHPNNPYILCIMTKGNSFEKLANVIKSISATTYNQVDAWGQEI